MLGALPEQGEQGDGRRAHMGGARWWQEDARKAETGPREMWSSGHENGRGSGRDLELPKGGGYEWSPELEVKARGRSGRGGEQRRRAAMAGRRRGTREAGGAAAGWGAGAQRRRVA